MARIRTIKPAFFRSQPIADLPLTARITFIGLWTYVDDEGRGIDDPRLVKGDLWPLDEKHTAKRVDADLDALASLGLVTRYEVAGRRYLQVVGFKEHQRINRPQPSLLPPPAFSDPSVNGRGTRTEHSPPEGKGIGREEEVEVEGNASSSETDSPPEPATAEDDDETEQKLKTAALEALHRRQADRPDKPVTDPDAWLREDRRRHDTERRTVLAQGGTLSSPTAPPSPYDNAQAAERQRIEREQARARGDTCPACNDVPGWGQVELDDGTYAPCPTCRPDDHAALGLHQEHA